MAVKSPEKPRKAPKAAPVPAPEEQAAPARPEPEEAPAPRAQAQQKDADAPIFVRAIRVGHYDNVRHYPAGFDHPRAGHVFVLRPRDGARKTRVGRENPIHLTAEQQFSERWMERVSEENGRAAINAQSRRPHKAAVITKSAADRNVI